MIVMITSKDYLDSSHLHYYFPYNYQSTAILYIFQPRHVYPQQQQKYNPPQQHVYQPQPQKYKQQSGPYASCVIQQPQQNYKSKPRPAYQQRIVQPNYNSNPTQHKPPFYALGQQQLP